MENPINQEDPETNTKEPVKAEEPAASNSGERSDGATSPPPNCSICLGKLINTSFTDSCLHQFCFTCLLQWSRIKTECPLCKQTFKSIIHNVRSEEDYDQYHVPRETHISQTHITTQALALSSALSNASISAYQRFAYRTTMTPSRRYGRLFAGLQANSSHHSRQEPPPVSISHPPPVSAQERRQRRNIYRSGEWSDPVSNVYSRFRQCSAEYYRRYPQEINRLIPWINRDLQTIFNPEQTPIAYVLDRITSLLQRYDMRSPEFRNEIRPLLQLETDHFIHELMNYASTDLTMAAYDDTVTYYNSFNPHGLSGLGYWHHVQSQTSSSTSSTISDDSDIRVVDHVDPSGSEVPSVGPHLISFPGPSTVSQVLQLQTPEVRPFVLTITSSSSESECEIVGYVKPRCERTPEIIELMSSGDEEIINASSNSVPDLESPRSPSPLSPINDQPSTSESSRRLSKNSKSKTSTRQLDRISPGSSESSSDSDSDFEESQTKKLANRRTSKHSTKVSKPSKSPRKSSGKKSDVSKKRSKHSYSSSDSPSPRESKCRRMSLNNSRKTTRAYISSSESDEDQPSSRNTEESSKTVDKDDKSKINCRVRVRKDLINGKKKHKRRTRRSSSSSTSSTSSSSSESESESSNSSLDTTSTSLTTSSSYKVDKYKVDKSRKKKRSKSKRSSKQHKSTSDNLRRHNRSRSRSKSRSRSRSRSRSKSRSRSRSRSREELSDASEHYSVNERYRERKAAKIANKKLKNKHLYAMTDSQNDEEAYRSNSQCSEISDKHKASKSSEKKYKGESNSKAKSHKTKSHKKSSKKKRVKTRGETEKRPRRRITSSSSSSSFSST